MAQAHQAVASQAAAQAQPVTIPYSPRQPQAAIHQALEQARFVVAVCHRRLGKTVAAVNHLIRAALTSTRERPRYGYVAPFRNQAKAVAWDYLKHYSAPIPGCVINEGELRIDYPTGGQVRLWGADNADAMRGLYFDGLVLDEFGLMAPTFWSEVIRPLLADRRGWCLFAGTPNGQNQFYSLAQSAQADRSGHWRFVQFKASETGLIAAEELASARESMTLDEYAQEWECSFEASVKGAIYARELALAREQGRITVVPYDPALPVDTDWDLGVGDATAIWFSQTLYSGQVRVIDYYEHVGEGLPHYVKVLQKKPYTYGAHWAPHDIQVRELGSGHSRLEAARKLGLAFRVSPKVESLEDGIHAVRLLFPLCWFDAAACRAGLDALQAYKWDYNTRIQGLTTRPVHDWASHGADALRGLAHRHYVPRRDPEKMAASEVRRLQRDVDPYDQRMAGGRVSRAGY